MLVPTKHEDLKLNVLVLGAAVMKVLKKQSHNIESLFLAIRAEQPIPIEAYFDTLLFLWLGDLIEIENKVFVRRKINAS